MTVLTFRIYGLVRAKDVDFEVVIVGKPFGVPEGAVTLFLDIAAQQ